MIKKQWNVGILLYDGVDVLDYAGPYEVFTLSVYEEKDVPQLLMKGFKNKEKPFVVKTFSQFGDLITSNNGLKVKPDYSFENVDVQFDIVIVPGGPLFSIKEVTKNNEILKWISEFHQSGKMVASVCSGAILLAEAGLLSGKKATTHWFAVDYMKSKYEEIEIVKNTRFVDEGNILTSAGVSAGIDMSLYIVEKLMGEEVARITASTEDYPYWSETKRDEKNKAL